MSLRKAFEQSDDEGESEIHNKEISRLFVRNLAFLCTDEEQVDFFKPFGEISQVSSILNCIFFCLSWITFFLTPFHLRSIHPWICPPNSGKALHI